MATWIQEVVVEINKARRAFCIKHGKVPGCIACSRDFLDKFKAANAKTNVVYEVGATTDRLLGMRIVHDDRIPQWALRE
jgi:hypothetical protein